MKQITINNRTKHFSILAIIMVALGLSLLWTIPLGIGNAASAPRTIDDSRYDLSHNGDINELSLPLMAADWDASSIWTGNCRMIQQAIDALPPEGGQVIVQTGVHICDEPILIGRDNVVLRGQGPATVLRLADHANSPVIVLGETAEYPAIIHSNIHIADLTIDGNRQNQEHECWGGACDSGGLTHIRNNGITLRRVSDVLIERVSVIGAPSGGLVSERGCQRLTVRDFTATDNEYDGLAAYQTENSVFSGLHLHGNTYAGLSFDWGFNHNIISDAIIANNGDVGVFMVDSRNNEFHGVQIRNNGNHGIFLAQRDAEPTTAASGNTFNGLVISNSARAGLRVNDASVVDTLVVGTQFIGNTGGCTSEADPGQVVASGTICR